MPPEEVPLPLTATPAAWLAVALADLDAVHQDHLHCERKAAQSALSLVRSYPEHTEVVQAVARLAHEETAHVVQVSQLLGKKGIAASKDFGDEYAAALGAHVRRGEPHRLLDRLLVFALIEARSAERLALLATAIPDEATAHLYGALASAEVRHRDMFLELAEGIAPDTWRDRLAVLARAEADIIGGLPLRARIH
ncbi:MAG TPA: tRNA isopentenyl-2-thiomethyl-A-37 hydroxylase MiaE [Kofleriaceae bacterium]|nr:tRNA isopentenyl-2-thiomethyl-A-37 hydroxylase MiaE [Kofleriaceae bacterium]